MLSRRGLALAVILATPLGACGVNEDLYKAKVAELDKTKADLDRTQADADAAKKKAAAQKKLIDDQNEALKLRLQAVGQDMSSLNADLDSAKKRMEELKRAQEAAEKRAAQYNDMIAKFKSMVEAGKLEVEIRDGLMLVKLPDNILFDPGRTDLKPAGQEAIKQVAQILSGIEGRKFQVAGHTDNIPIKSAKYKSNWELSTQRAVEVVRYMSTAAGKGMDKRLSAAGYADTLPVDPANTDAARRKNRRIEIVVVPNMDDLPKIEGLNAPKK